MLKHIESHCVFTCIRNFNILYYCKTNVQSNLAKGIIVVLSCHHPSRRRMHSSTARVLGRHISPRRPQCTHVPLKSAHSLGKSGPLSNKLYLRPTWISTLNGISIGSAVFAQLPCAEHTDRYKTTLRAISVVVGRIYALRTRFTWCGLKMSKPDECYR